MNDVISIYAPGDFDIADSYGLIACQLARHLTSLGAYVNAVALGNTQTDGQPADIRAITHQPIRASLGGIVLAYPTAYEKYGPLSMAGARIAISMFESTRLPDGWADSLNRCAAVVVPSQFCKQVFEDAGVVVPIHVIPLGINEEYRPVMRDHSATPFTFLAFADRGQRKGSHEAVQGFLRAFGDDPDYRLILKMRERDVQVRVLNPNIEMVQQDMSADELYKLYQRAHCMIFAAKGEGFGLPPREFAASGGEVIATAWGGLLDDIDEWAWPLDCWLEPAWKGHPKFENANLGYWAKPDIDDLQHIMGFVAQFREPLLHLAHHRAPRLHELYSWRRFAEGVYDIWKDVTRSKVYASIG